MASERLSQRLSRYWMMVLLVLASFTVAGCAAIGFVAAKGPRLNSGQS
jgi:hypothetical protein